MDVQRRFHGIGELDRNGLLRCTNPDIRHRQSRLRHCSALDKRIYPVYTCERARLS